jgi:uncharacterized membrane protein YheB (UPF0754 family)
VEIFGLTPLQWLLPITIGIISGLSTNAVAIWMLFHPYEPFYIGPFRVLPKGAIPKEIDRIARRVGETVGNELLTPEDITRTLSSPVFRDRFDEVLRNALQGLLARELGPLKTLITPAQRAEFDVVLDRVMRKLVEGVEIFLRSPEWEARLRRFARRLTTELRDRPLSEVLTPGLQEDMVRGAGELWRGLAESPDFERAVSDALERAMSSVLESDRPLRHYIPSGAVNLGEAVVAQYLPLLLERLGTVLEDPATRAKLQDVLRRFVDRFLEEQQTWKRIVGRLVMTERTLAQTVEAIEHGGADEISALLREPEVQARVAAAVNDGVEDVLDRPLRDLVGDLSPERAERIRETLASRLVYALRHPNTEAVVRGRLEAVLAGTAGRTLGDLLDLLGPERAGEMEERVVAWTRDALRSPRASASLERGLERQSAWLLSVPIGRIGGYLPQDAVRRAEQILFDPLWSFLQRRVPTAVADLPVARMVENKLKAYPVQKVEELVWRVSGKELGLIVYLGGFLGAMVGGTLLFTLSWPAGAVTTLFFMLLALVFINWKA